MEGVVMENRKKWIGRMLGLLCICCIFAFYNLIFDFTGKYKATKVEVGKCYYYDGLTTRDFKKNPYIDLSNAPEYLDAFCILSEKDGWFDYYRYTFYPDKNKWHLSFQSQESKYSYPFTECEYELDNSHELYHRSFEAD